jgi:hypothetical protein
MLLVLSTHAFGKAIFETSKSYNLFIQYPNNILVRWNPLENGDKTYKIFFHFNNNN